MQNPYTGDIGDYGKYILLDALAGSDLRLAVVWYLNPYVGDGADGKFTSYLTEAKEKRYRHASPSIYDGLRKIVRNGVRRVSFVRKEGILPANTIFYEAPLDYLKFSLAADRKKARQEWLLGALNETREADLVFFDPDNGLEVKSHTPHSKLGAKYIFENEIRTFWERNQSILVYQHLNRSGSVNEQARRGLARLRAISDGNECWAIGFHSYSVRLYFVVPIKNHASELRGRTRKLECGPCKSVLGVKLYDL
jgi:hypothetical protein